MNQTRYCQVQGHQENNTTYICISKDCKLDSKWVCVDCIVQQIHNHGLPNQNHLLKFQQFLNFIKKQSKLMQIQKQEDTRLIQICIKGLQHFIQSTQFLIQMLQEDLVAIQNNYNLEEIEEIINITKENCFLLENKQIEKIININNNYKNFQYNLSQDVLKQLMKIDGDLQKLLENNFNKQNVQLLYQRHFQYTQESYINTSQISYDEKYLVFGGKDSNMQVYDIPNKQFIKSIQIGNNGVYLCRFTKDSKYLISSDSLGYIYCFETNNNFELQYKNQIHSMFIYDILSIDNDQIVTCSQDYSIRITNIKEKTQKLLIQNAHNSSINTVDFNQQNDVIISGSDDKSIKFFNKTTGVVLFHKKNAHDNSVLQIQLISNLNNNLLSSGQTNLILWLMDYHNKQLIKIQVLDQNHFNFSSVANGNRIILICDDEVKILSQNLSLVQSINHNFKISNYFDTRQINSMNYIIVLSFSALQVLKQV